MDSIVLSFLLDGLEARDSFLFPKNHDVDREQRYRAPQNQSQNP